jgi:DNA-directed RNA polymerase subunit RPC12/RpoP
MTKTPKPKPHFGKAKCSYCGKSFEKHRKAQHACSQLCRNRGFWKKKKDEEAAKS